MRNSIHVDKRALEEVVFGLSYSRTYLTRKAYGIFLWQKEKEDNHKIMQVVGYMYALPGICI